MADPRTQVEKLLHLFKQMLRARNMHSSDELQVLLTLQEELAGLDQVAQGIVIRAWIHTFKAGVPDGRIHYYPPSMKGCAR